MVYSLLIRLATKYSTVLILPITTVIGFIGYKLENIISDKYTPPLKSIPDERNERLLSKENEVQSIKEHKFVPETIFEKNLPPSLIEPDPRLKKPSNWS